MNKGSLTIEASIIMVVLLMLIFSMILLTFYIHNRAWYTAATGEAVITASLMGAVSKDEGEQILMEKMGDRLNRQGFPMRDISAEGSVTADKVRVSVMIRSIQLMGIGNWETMISQEEETVRPTSFIRKIMSLKEWREMIG